MKYYSTEKLGGVPREERRMEVFREALKHCGLVDMGYSGAWYTLERGNIPKTNIRERLDRAVANDEFLSLYPNALVHHLPYSHSDHCPLLIHLEKESFHKPHIFCFEAWWLLEDDFEQTVKRLWANGVGDIVQKLHCVQAGLECWAKRIQGEKRTKRRSL